MNQSKPLTPYGKRASILATLKMVVVLVLSGANGIRYAALWLLFKKRRVQSLGLYMFAAASRTLLNMMRADDIQMIIGLRALSVELQTPFYRSLTKKALGFNTNLDTSAGKHGAELAPDLSAPACVWLWEVSDRKPQDPVIYFMHGGAFALGMTFTQVYWIVNLVKALPQHRLSVLALDYSLSPYAKYPTQLNEAFYGFDALAKTCDRIITLGDSAGGTLSGALAISLEQYPDLYAKLFGQIYVSPWTELLPSKSGSVFNNAHSDWVCDKFAARCAAWYLDVEVDEERGVFKAAIEDPKADLAVSTAQQLRSALPRNVACVWSANELLSDAIERFCVKGNITDTFVEHGTIHDVLYFGHNNDSSRYIVGVINKWLSAPADAKHNAQASTKDKAPKDQAPKDQAPKYQAPKDQAPKDQAPKDKAPKETAPTSEKNVEAPELAKANVKVIKPTQ